MKIIVITAYASIDTAVEAMRRGATDYIPKPFTPGQVAMAVRKVEQVRTLEQKLAGLQEDLDRTAPSPGSAQLSRDAAGGGDGPAGGAVRRRDPAAGGERAPERRLSPARSTAGARAPEAVRGCVLPGHSGRTAGERAVRPRQGGLYRGGSRQRRPHRVLRRGNAPPRRGRRSSAFRSTQAVALPAGSRIRASRGDLHPPGRRSRRQRHEPGPRGRDRGRAVPRGPFLSVERHPGRVAGRGSGPRTSRGSLR